MRNRTKQSLIRPSLNPEGTGRNIWASRDHEYQEVLCEPDFMASLLTSHSISDPLEEEDEFQRKELLLDLAELLQKKIPQIVSEFALAVIQHYANGYTQVAIGEMLGCHQSAVHKSMYGNIEYVAVLKKKVKDPITGKKTTQITKVPYAEPRRYGGSIRKIRDAMMLDPEAISILQNLGVYDDVRKQQERESAKRGKRPTSNSDISSELD